MNSLTYLTRLCPRKCEYCDLRNSRGLKRELNADEWIRAFQILKEMGIKFNLILGNETWNLGRDLLKIMNENKVPYALYTSCFLKLFNLHFESFFNSSIDNLSCGIDYSLKYLVRNKIQNDMERKSWDGWSGLIFTRREFPHVDCHGTITMNRRNMFEIPEIIEGLSKLGVFVALNFIHWNKDGNYDFFPGREVIEDLLFKEEDTPEIEKILNNITNIQGNLVQNIKILKPSTSQIVNMGWHCKGDPYGGPTIDADGALRVCGYRRGTYTPKYKIWDLPSEFIKWKNAVELDALNCPGCVWTYPMGYAYWRDRDPKFGDKVFVKHAEEHIPENKWSKRKVE